MSNSHKVLLLNYDLSSNARFGTVCGASGKTYKQSQFNTKYNAHVAEFTMEEYDKAIPDISRSWHRPMCRWIPKFMEVEAGPVLMQPQPPPVLQNPDFLQPGAPLVSTTEGSAPEVKIESANISPDISKLPYLSLKKIAKQHGVFKDGLNCAELREAILSTPAV